MMGQIVIAVIIASGIYFLMVSGNAGSGVPLGCLATLALAVWLVMAMVVGLNAHHYDGSFKALLALYFPLLPVVVGGAGFFARKPKLISLGAALFGLYVLGAVIWVATSFDPA